MALLEEVFGVSAKQVQSYVERPEVDNRFRDAILSDKEVIVYGSSKQGKTALVSKHLPYDKHILVSLTPKTTALDIYQTILNRAGVRLAGGSTEKRGSESSIGITTRVKAVLPFFGGGEAAPMVVSKLTAARNSDSRRYHSTSNCLNTW